jgi:hypothetical protein
MDRMEMGSKERRRHGFVFDYTAQNEHGDAKKKRWKDAGGSELSLAKEPSGSGYEKRVGGSGPGL